MNAICDNIMNEALVSTIGLLDESTVQIKGDVSMRETAMDRPKVDNFIDKNFDEFVEKIHKILTSTGVYHMTVCFHNKQIVTRKVFEPYSLTAHNASSFFEDGYIDRQFPPMTYRDKIKIMRKVCHFLGNSKKLRGVLPRVWQQILFREHYECKPIDEKDIGKLLAVLKPLRDLEYYYLRKFDISLSQNLVEFQFNCDGTHIMQASVVEQFVNDIV